MGLVEEAYQTLFSGKEIGYTPLLRYSGRFRSYNANIQLHNRTLTVSLSKRWKGIDRKIQIGLIQELMVRLFRKRLNTMEMDLYNIFMKKVHLAAPKNRPDPTLEASFLRVNERFFSGLLDKPNLEWSNSMHRLGSYDFGTDTIRISSVLKDDLELVDYVAYHELLHKKLKFNAKYGRTRSHTPLFRKNERLFPNHAALEGRIGRICRRYKLKRILGF